MQGAEEERNFFARERFQARHGVKFCDDEIVKASCL